MNRFAALLVVLFIAALMTACATFQIDVFPRQAPYEETVLSGKGADKILVVDLSGALMMGDYKSPFSPFSRTRNIVAEMTEQLDKAKNDEAVKALIVRIDSPGGSVTASDVLHHQILTFKNDKKVPVVAMMLGTAASGGYYAATAADNIVALPTTITGSIGVIALKPDFSGLMAQHGVAVETVKSARLKDMWSPLRPATKEERDLMQAQIDALFERFKAVVRKGRPNMTPEQFERAVTAQIFTADKALSLGLIDQIGYPEDAIKLARELAKIPEARVVTYRRPGSYRPNVYAGLNAPDISADADMSPWVGGLPQFMYIWLPETFR